jgi:membrane-associated phospholipid phosphatase
LCAFALPAQTTNPPAPDVSIAQSPPLNTFGSQLLNNLRATFTSKQNLLPLVAGSGATAVSSIWDSDVQEFFADPGKAAVAGDVGQWLGGPLVVGGIAGGTLLIGYKTEHHKLRGFGYDLSQAFIIGQGLTQAMKFAVQRERPNGENNYSFPSGHSSASFAMAVVVSHHFPKATVPAYGVAGFVAFSRLVKDKHWLSDTVGGATLGVIVGMTVVREDLKLSVGKITFSPHIPYGGGIGINASIQL